MTACASCGRSNPEDARFCAGCGAQLAPALPERRKLATLLFCDLFGSTSMGERLDVESVRELMFRYFHAMRAAIERHGGTVEKFAGDAVLAVFGVPIAHEDDALRALRAAAEMRERLAALAGDAERRFGARLALRIGVNTGEVVAGETAGSGLLVTGDAVNVAARLEQSAGTNEILVGERTVALAGEAATVEPLEPLRLKGKDEPVPVFRLLEVVPGAGRAPRLTGPLVGRDAELDRLTALFEQVVSERRCGIVTILGEPGVGKSRLAAELGARASGSATVLHGRCLSYGEGITFWPLAELVREAAGIRDDLPADEARRRLVRLTEPAVAAPLASAIGLPGPPGDRDEIAWAFRRLFETLAADRPLVAIVEDLHWAEPTLLELLLSLCERVEAPVLVLCTARPELLETAPDWEATVTLEPLGADEVAELLASWDLEGEVRRRVIEAAGGNPLFAEELAALLREEPDERALPTSLNALLTARLDRLPDLQRRVAECASIEGVLFHSGAVAELSNARDRPALEEGLDGLVARGLVRPAKAEYAGEGGFRFRHVLIRDAAYGGVPKRVRAELHERFAAWLEQRSVESGREQEEFVAYHLEQAVRYRSELGLFDDRARALAGEAAGLLALAGRRALGRDDAPAAVNLLERAARLRESGSTEHLELLLDHGEALREAGELVRADETLRRAIDGAAAAGERRIALRARLELAFLQRYIDPGAGVDELLKVAEEAAAVFEELEDDAGISRALRLAGEAHWSNCRIAAMTEAFERALSHAQRTGEARELAAINRGLVRAALAGPMQADPAIAHCEELLERAPGDRTLRAMVAGAVGVLRAMRGEFEEARESGAWAVALFEELGKPVLAGAMRCWAAEVELYAGEPEQAERILAPAYELLEARGETGILASVAAYLAQAALARGALEEAERLTRTSARSASVDDVHAQVAWRVVRARVRSRLGQLGEAEAVGRAACALAAETDYANLVGDAFSCLGAVLLAGGRADEAASELERALAAYEAKGNEVAAAAVRSELDRLGGTTSVASGGSDASPSSESLTGRTTGPPIG